ncbi:MAG: GNAT family N-acetyltransferase [Thermoplasmata archaeon]
MSTEGEHSTSKALILRHASPQEVDLAASILTEAAEWSMGIGNPHPWPRPFPSEILQRSADRGELFLAETASHEIAGTLTLQWEDPLFWGVQPPVAGYLHRLALRRAFAGQGLGRRMIQWAEERVRERGREFLRLDCDAENARIRSYYEALEFRFVSDAEKPGVPFRCALYQKRVAHRASPRGRS